jgi:hydrogenase maturation protease
LNYELLIGIGNSDRGDDGAGREVVRRLRNRGFSPERLRELDGEAASILEAWKGANKVLLIDAMQSGRPPGTILRFDATSNPVPTILRCCSTHGFGVAAAVELARALDLLPDRVEIIGIEIESPEVGPGLTPAVESAVEALVTELAGKNACAQPTRPVVPPGS